MLTSDPSAIEDAAYGIFEIFLSRRLQDKGERLYTLVEEKRDFTTDFHEIFEIFTESYSQAAEALIHKFSSSDNIYRLLINGEGVIPLMTTQMYWIIQDAPGESPGVIESDLAGKWLIFLDSQEVDSAWMVVRDATVAGRLGISAKVSTSKQNPESRDNMKVICVYTRDWSDKDDVMRVREELRSLGFTSRMGYKRNIETFAGEYSRRGKRVTYYSA